MVVAIAATLDTWSRLESVQATIGKPYKSLHFCVRSRCQKNNRIAACYVWTGILMVFQKPWKSLKLHLYDWHGRGLNLHRQTFGSPKDQEYHVLLPWLCSLRSKCQARISRTSPLVLLSKGRNIKNVILIYTLMYF